MPPLQEIVDLTKALIRIPSMHSRPQEIQRCADFIAAWLDERDIAYRRLDIDNIPSLIVLPKVERLPGAEGMPEAGRLAEAESVPVLYMAHFDVVAADIDDLFLPREEDGKLYGRGAIDDKYAVALLLVLFQRHLEALRKKGRTKAEMGFGLLLTGDEEVGGAKGAGAALKWVRPAFFVALDGGGPQRIVTREKGILQLDLVTRGKAAHGARPWLGENAFDRLVADYHAIRRFFGVEHEVPPPGDHWHKTLVLSNCRAGDGCVNKVPDLATATLDIRYTEAEDPDDLLRVIRTAVNHSQVTVRAKVPLFVSGESPYLDLLLKTAGPVALVSEHGSSDARYPAAMGIPGVVWGAEGEMSQHSAEERLVIASLGTLYDTLYRFQAVLEGGAGALIDPRPLP
jgi:succinyl-diaminopimelate desuccinylase